MNQTALVFGPAQSNIGIVADPTPGVARRDVGVIILNAGILHRVGPARIHVTLARALQSWDSTRLGVRGQLPARGRELAQVLEDHVAFVRPGVEELINLQRDGRKAKVYQVRQVRAIILKYNLIIER